jgi:hypothetical protein
MPPVAMIPQRREFPVAERGSVLGWLDSHGVAMGAVMAQSCHSSAQGFAVYAL